MAMAVSGEVIIWMPLLFVIVVATLLQHSSVKTTRFNTWLNTTTVIPVCFHGLFRGVWFLSPMLSVSLTSFLAFCVAGLLPLALRIATYVIDFPNWSFGYKTSGVEAQGGRVLGELNFFMLAFVMLPVTHTSIIGLLTGISMERAIVFHRIWARLTILIMFIHGMWMWIAFGTASHELPPITPSNMNYVFIQRQYIKPFEHVTHMYLDMDTKWSNLSGLLAFLCFAGMGITSLPYFRRHHFEWFHASHLFLALLGFIFGYLHMPALARFAAPAWACYGLDLLLRVYRAHRWRGQAEIVALEGGITQVTVRIKNGKKPHFEAGQYAFIRLPTLSLFQNHPFSISSSPHEDFLTFHILSMPNGWTSQLHTLGSHRDVEGKLGCITTCYVDGPYGIPSIPLFEYPTLVMVVGGIGITPSASILSYLLHTSFNSSTRKNDSSSSSHHTRRIILIFTVSNKQVMDMFDHLLTQATTCEQVELHLYNTQRQQQHIPTIQGEQTQQPQQQTQQQEQHSGHHNKIQQSWRDQIKSGRPNLSDLFSNIVLQNDRSCIGVMSCGPEPLVLSTRDICHDMKLPFHRETFVL